MSTGMPLLLTPWSIVAVALRVLSMTIRAVHVLRWLARDLKDGERWHA